MLILLIAAIVEVAAITAIVLIRPDKAGDMAIPIAIIVCGLAGPKLSRRYYGAALLGGLLGVLDYGAFIVLSGLYEVVDKLTPTVRIAASIGFGAATAVGTHMWTEFARRSGQA